MRVSGSNGRSVGVVIVSPVVGTRRPSNPTVGPSQTGPTSASMTSDQASPVRAGQTGGSVVPSQARTRVSTSTVRVVKASPGVSTVGPSQSRPGMGRSTVRPGQTRSGDIGRVQTSSTMSTVIARQSRTGVGPVRARKTRASVDTVRTRKAGPRVSSTTVRTGKPRPVSLVQVVRLTSDRIDDDPSRVGMGRMNTVSTVCARGRVGVVGVVTGEEVGSGSPEFGRMRFTVFVIDGRA